MIFFFWGHRERPRITSTLQARRATFRHAPSHANTRFAPQRHSTPHQVNHPAPPRNNHPAAPQYKAPQSPAHKIVLYTGGGVVENARKANFARQQCKKLTDCHCPNNPASKAIHSTSCINGFCSCDNPVVGLFAGEFMNAVKAIGNSPITKAVGHLMQGLADVKEVLGTIVGAFLGPAAKAALKVCRRLFTVEIPGSKS
ncbi:hypothetical protein BDZ97DRAFT_1310583 [Flammula alnicola]|nr:hypothetical protein BDZ97DRAFT_1310583 [Flammula alnicola]